MKNKNKKRIISICLIILIILTFCLLKNNNTELNNKKIQGYYNTSEISEGVGSGIATPNNYEITYFYGIYADEMTDEQAKLIADAGFTVVPLRPSGNIRWQPDSVKETMTNAINCLKKYDIKVMVFDYRLSNGISLYSTNDDNRAQASLKDAAEFYGNFSNVIGYDICDEPYYDSKTPSVKDLGAVKKAINQLYELDPTRPCYMNLFPEPYTESAVNEYKNSYNITDYNSYLYDAINSKTKYLSVDHYPRYLKRTAEGNVDLYYDNLKILDNIYLGEKKTGYKNLITNNINLVSEGTKYKIAKQDIEYQVSASLAFGTKMTSYFTYATITDNPSRGNVTGILDIDKNPTDDYTYVKDINKWAINVGRELFNKDIRAVYLYNSTEENGTNPNTEYIEYENKKGQVGRIRSREYKGDTTEGYATGNPSYALVSVFDDNTMMIVNTDPFRESDYSNAESYSSTESTKKDRGLYQFIDITMMNNYQFFDSINNKWIDITNNSNRLSDMGVYISTNGNYILLDKGRNVLIRKKQTLTSNKYHINYDSKKITVYDSSIATILGNVSSDYTVVVKKDNETYTDGNVYSTGYSLNIMDGNSIVDTYSIEGAFSSSYDMNSRYIYTGLDSFNTSNVSADVTISTKDNVLNVGSSDGVYYNNIPIVQVSLSNGYTAQENNILIDSDSFSIDNVNITNGYGVYDDSKSELKIYSCLGDYIETKSIKNISNKKTENPIVVNPINELIYNGSEQRLLSTSNAKGTVYYSLDTELNSDNYSQGTTDIPTGTNPGNYKVYWYVTGDSEYEDKSGSLNVTISSVGLNVIAEGYEGEYDGNDHGITVTCEGATIKYGTNEGEYNLDSSPTRKNAGTTVVYYQVSKEGYETIEGSQNIKIEKAMGKVQIDNNEAIFLLKDNKKIGDWTLKVTQNLSGGKIEVQSTDENIAAVESIDNNIITLKSGNNVGEVTINVISEETTNYKEATALCKILVDNLKVEKVEIVQSPKTEYRQGEEIDLSNGKVKIYYNYGEPEIIEMSEGAKIEQFNTQEAGQQTVVISYDGNIVTYPINILKASEEQDNDSSNRDNSSNNDNSSNRDNSNNNDKSSNRNNNSNSDNSSKNNNNNRKSDNSSNDSYGKQNTNSMTTKETVKNQGSTVKSEKIPFAGENKLLLLVTIMAIVIIGIISFIKYRSLKGLIK